MPSTTKTDPKALDLIRRQLMAATGELVADYHRFVLSGMDYKGQISSGFGERGWGGKPGVSFDFGTLICPGFLHLQVEADITVTGAHRAMLVAHRMPSSVRRRAVRRRGSSQRMPPWWRNRTPIVLLLLAGESATGSLGARAKAWGGIGDPHETDETGLSVGARIQASGTLEVTRLGDDEPLHYASAFDDHLDEHVAWFLNQRIKQTIARWVNQLADAPADVADDWPMTKKALRGADAAIQTAAERWDDSKLTPVVGSADLGGIVGWLKRKIKQPPTAEKLRTALDTIEKDRIAALQRERAIRDRWRAGLGGELPAGTYARIDRYEGELLQVHRLRQALDRIESPVGQATKPPAGTKDAKGSVLHIWSAMGELEAGAAIKAVGNIPELGGAGGGAAGAVRGFTKRISYRYQVSSARHPDRDQVRRRVLRTQDTVLTHNAIVREKRTTGGVWKAGEPRPTETGSRMYGTASYRSVTVYWADPDPGPPAGRVRTALRNGSGISFGVSVDGKRVREAGADFFEFLERQLRVERYAMRRFLSSADVSWLREDSALLIEAGYEFLDDDVTFTVRTTEKGRLMPAAPLAELEPVRRRLQQQGPDLHPETGNGTTRLQVLRLRIRLADQTSDRRSAFSLGYSQAVLNRTEVEGESDALRSAGEPGDAVKWGPWKLGLAAEVAAPALFRTRASGHEATLDFHTRYFGGRGPKYTKPAEAITAQEYSVPPVALFNH